MGKPRCYVAMGYGKKTDFSTGRTLDLDKTYTHLIKPSVESAGYDCLRGDEIPRSEIFDISTYEQLLDADLVIVDLSTGNLNATYELGVRFALSPRSTLVIAESRFQPPFDILHFPILRYVHHGEVLDIDEARAFINKLSARIVELRDGGESANPVYSFLPGLRPPSRASRPASSADVRNKASIVSIATMRDGAQALMDEGKFIEAEKVFRGLLASLPPGDPNFTDVAQRLVLAAYESEQPTRADALQRAMSVLEVLEPDTSNDPETLVLAGDIRRGLWEETRDPLHIEGSIRAYERGFYLRQDHHNGINLAFMFDVRAAASDSDRERVADRVNAERVRRQILEVVEVALTQFRRDLDVERRGGPNTKDGEYWVLSTKAQALVGLGDEEGAAGVLAEAKPLARAEWMLEKTDTQLEWLRKLLAADNQS